MDDLSLLLPLTLPMFIVSLILRTLFSFFPAIIINHIYANQAEIIYTKFKHKIFIKLS
jgi:hypothetical protein